MKEHLNVDMLLNQKDALFSSTVFKKKKKSHGKG